jgi:hypothetical protein
MSLTHSPDGKPLKKAQESAAERDTAAAGRKRGNREALERSFASFQFEVGEQTWSRADLHARS